MKCQLDLTKEYGLVLEGGGAKGAFQIGAYKALQEAGVKIRGIAGTSVGGLNGALICTGIELAEKIWQNITFSSIMDIDDEVARKLLGGKLPLPDVLSQTTSFLKNKGYDVTPLKELIRENLDPAVVQNSPMDLYVMTYNVDEAREEEINLKEVEPELLPDFLLATAYMAPVFKTEPLHGVHYIDGGAEDNVPIDTLLAHDYKDIIVIRIFGIGKTRSVEIPDDVTVVEIDPSRNLGSIMDFDGKKAKRNMVLGYLDAQRVIYGLTGKIYYLDDAHLDEKWYLREILDLVSNAGNAVLAGYGVEHGERLWVRKTTEKICPDIATELKLAAGWTYRELYLSMLEATARLGRISKYRVYRPEELLEAILAKREKIEKKKLPLFARVLLEDTKEEKQ